MRAIFTLVTLLVFLVSPAARGQTERWSDDMRPADWKAVPADGVTSHIEEVQEAGETFLRLHYSFDRGGGFVVLRRVVELDLAANFVLTFDVRAEGPRQNLEIKLLDDATAAAGGNVWWINRPAFGFTKEWQTVTQRRKHFGFAWGPDSKKGLKKIRAVEFGIASASGGKGHVDFRRVRYEARGEVRAMKDLTPRLSVAEVDGVYTLKAGQACVIELGETTEIGGITAETVGETPGPPLLVETRDRDGRATAATTVLWEAGFGYCAVLPDRECASVVLRALGAAAKFKTPRVHGPEWSDTPNHLVASIGQALPRGRLPRWARGEQNYWTVSGHLASDDELLISEDGAIELGRTGPTLEPFVIIDGHTLGWADAEIRQELLDGCLPMPRVIMTFAKYPWLELRVELVEAETRFLAGYELRNTGGNTQDVSLLIGVRPFQVLPPTQWLNVTGGFTPLMSLECSRDRLVANNDLVAWLHPAANQIGGAAGLAIDLGSIPTGTTDLRMTDPAGTIQGVMRCDAHMTGQTQAKWIVTLGGAAAANEQEFGQALSAAHSRWSGQTEQCKITLPRAWKDVEETIRAQQGYILVNQDGAGTQPGSRTYERSWIRDGALTSVAMLRLGHPEFTRAFLDWYAGFQYESGKIPCVVDKRGSDPVDEHDSTGEYLYATSTYFEYTQDKAFLERHWGHIEKAVGYLHGLIEKRSGPEYRDGEGLKHAMYGLVPESISHEGYSSKPMHSYWDCFFTSKGLREGVKMAMSHGNDALSKKWALAADQFDRCVEDSIRQAQAIHKISYVPGCVELGDFDATSTAIGVWPCDFLTRESTRGALRATLERYTEFFRKRAAGTWAGDDYTPYELRLVGVVATQGDPEIGLEMLKYFMGDQRPKGWRHWAEVVGRDARTPRFIGDMPHTWCGTEFLNSILNMVVLEEGEQLRIAEGFPWSLLEPTATEPNPEVRVEGVLSRFGSVSARFTREAEDRIRVVISLPATLPGGAATIRLPEAGGWIPGAAPDALESTSRGARLRLKPGVNNFALQNRTGN